MAIIRHDLPFQFVEYEGIREAFRYASYANRDITLKCRNTAKAYIVKIFLREKIKLKKLLHSVPGRICLTSDLWTSITTDGYISLTAHFVNKEWKLQKRIISFSYMSSPHTGSKIADKIHTLLAEWGIENKIFSITLDNASSNLTFVKLLKTQLNLHHALLCDGSYFHIRCCCHIINLIVQDGISVIDTAVVKIRDSVKYFRGHKGGRWHFLIVWDRCQYPDSIETHKVRTKLNTLYDLYVSIYDVPTTSSTPVQVDPQVEFHQAHGNDLLMDFESYESEGYETSSQKTQLELYLMEHKMKITDKLDVLDFWKSNQFRYPELSKMAADILSIPVSTVASESEFSTGGRVLDQYRSALLPTNVEALVCTSDWLFKVKDVLAPTTEELTEDVMEEMMRGGLSQQDSNAPTTS